MARLVFALALLVAAASGFVAPAVRVTSLSTARVASSAAPSIDMMAAKRPVRRVAPKRKVAPAKRPAPKRKVAPKRPAPVKRAAPKRAPVKKARKGESYAMIQRRGMESTNIAGTVVDIGAELGIYQYGLFITAWALTIAIWLAHPQY